MPYISLDMIEKRGKPKHVRRYAMSERQCAIVDRLYDMGKAWLAYACRQQWEQDKEVPINDTFPEELHNDIAEANMEIR